MVYYEKAYIRHYKRNDNKNNRILKSVEVRGLKTTTKFKDKEPIIIISEKEFNKLNNDLNQMQDTNKELTSELNNMDNNKSHETKQLYIKLLDLMEIVNNRNELLLNANDNLNYMLDAIIQEIENEFNIIIDANHKEIKEHLETFIKSVVNKANETQTRQNNLIIKECENLETQIKDINNELNKLSLFDLIRHRKQFNIKLDLSNLKNAPSDAINYNDLNINLASEKILTPPDFKKLDHVKIKKSCKHDINFNDLYINFDSENNL